MSLPNFHSTYLMSGICKGISQRSITNKNTGEVSTITELGLAEFRKDEFGDVKEVVTKVQISKSLVAKGAPGKLVALKGQRLIIPVWHSAFNSKSGPDFNNFLTNDWETNYFVYSETVQAAS